MEVLMAESNSHKKFECLPDGSAFIARGGNVFIKAVNGSEHRGLVGNKQSNAITMSGQQITTAHFDDITLVVPYDEEVHGYSRAVAYMQEVLVHS